MNKIFEKFQNFNTHQEVASVLIQLFITGVVTMVSSYVYQLFSWKFDNFYGVLMAFVIVVFIFSGIILFLFNILKRNKLSGHSEKKIPLLKAPFVYASIGIIAVLIAFLFTIIDFFKYVNVLSSIDSIKNNVSIYEYSGSSGEKDSPKDSLLIIDYLRGEKVDGKTLSFANKIFDELSEEIENRKLPIQICPGSDLLVAIDTLLETHKGVYTIKGSFDEYLGARIEVRNIFYDDAVKKFLDQLSLPLLMQDSLLQALKSNILKTKIFKIESYDKNELMSEYQFRFGVPTEINFFIYSTIGDLIVNDIVRTNVIDSNNIVSNEALLNYGLSVLKLAEYYIPTKVSLWGSKRTPKDLPAAYRIYSNIANVYNYKSRLETRKKDYRNSSLNGEISNIPAIDNIRKSDYYLNKLPRHYRSNAKEVEEGLRYYISFFDNQLTKGALELDIISRKSDALLMETNNLLNNSQKPFTVPGFFDYPKSSISLPTNEQAIRWLKTSREILKRIRRLKKDFLKAKYKLAIYVYYVKNIESQNNEVQSLLAIANNFLTVYEPMNKKYEETIQKAEAMEQGMDKIADLSKKRN